MIQRVSGYERIPGDTYVTPQWVWDALRRVEPVFNGAWDCCPENADFDILALDDIPGLIATNTPYGKLGEIIVRHILGADGFCVAAFLFPNEWDTAKGRRDLFEGPHFSKKWVLTKRIRWANLNQKLNGPSSNHAWYVFLKNSALYKDPTIGWLP